MTLSWHMISQVLLSVLQVLNMVSGQVSPKWQPVVLGGISLVQITLAYIAHHYTPDGQKIVQSLAFVCLLVLLISSPLSAQVVKDTRTYSAEAPVFSTTSVSLSLTPITLPGVGQSLSGAETDVMWAPTPNNAFGETNLISGPGSLIGGRYNRYIPQFQKWFDNLSPSLNGYQLQLYVTGSLGVVKSSEGSHWGERAGLGVNYGINNTWGVGFEVQANNLPGISHWTPSFVFGPNFHF